MMLLRRTVLMVLVMFALPSFCLAGWVGPKEVVKGKWGNKPGEFGVVYGDTEDNWPDSFCISSNGLIVVSDQVNQRIEVFKNDGTVSAILKPVFSEEQKSVIGSYPWPLRMVCLNDQIYAEFNIIKQIYELNGKLTYNLSNIVGDIISQTKDGGFVTIDKGHVYYKYQNDGRIIIKYNSKPTEIGTVVKSRKHIFIKYENIEYEIQTYSGNETYYRDRNNYLYLISGREVHKLDLNAKYMGKLDLPEDLVLMDEVNKQVEPGVMVHQQFGDPIIDNIGNVYIAKRAINDFTILKWTWQDDPNTTSGPDAKIKQAACDNTSFMKTDMRLTAADLAGKSKEYLRLMRNEIYARHGKTFQSADLQKYFSGKCWYKADPGYSDAMLTPVDREKIRIVQEAEKCK